MNIQYFTDVIYDFIQSKLRKMKKLIENTNSQKIHIRISSFQIVFNCLKSLLPKHLNNFKVKIAYILNLYRK